MALLAHSPEISPATKIFFAIPKPSYIRRIRISSGTNEKVVSKASLRVPSASRSKDCEIRVSEFDRNVRMYGQFSAPTKQGSNPSKEDEEAEKQNYYVNLGYAIRVLREEFPELFYRELSFDIYRDDIVFKDPFNTFTGIENYKSIFSALRFHGKIFFKALWIDVLSIWQPMDNVIMVRWAVHGIPRIPWEARGRFDGTSEYKLDKKGKIFKHRVDNVALNKSLLNPKFRVQSVEELIQSLGCPSTPPKPTLFETSSLSFSSSSPESSYMYTKGMLLFL